MACRIIIVGAPGAGKSTLARGLADQLGVSCYPLDPVAFVDERWTPRSTAERSRMIEEIMAEPCWIAEGVHLGWTDPLFAAADHVVWLDPPWWTLLWRAGRRYVARWASQWPPRPDLRALFIEGWLFVGRYYWQHFRPGMDLELGRNLSRAATAAALAPYAEKVQHSRGARVSPTAVVRHPAMPAASVPWS
jgi:hypothetical protein